MAEQYDPKLAEKTNNLLREQLALEKELQKIRENVDLSTMDKVLKSHEKEVDLLRRKISLNQKDNKEIEQAAKLLEQTAAKLEAELNNNKSLKELEKQSIRESLGLLLEELSVYDKILDSREKSIKYPQQQIKQDKKRIILIQKYDEALKKQNMRLEQSVSTVKSLGKMFFNIAESADDSHIGKFVNIVGSLGKGAFWKGIAPMAGGAIASVADSFLEKMVQIAMADDQATAAFNRTTGAAGKYNQQIIGLNRQLRLSGVSQEDAANSINSLWKNMQSFTQLNKNEQNRLAGTTALMEKLGVSTDDSANFMESAMLTLGKSGAEAEKLTREFHATARALNVQPGMLVAEFNRSMPVLSKFGNNAPRVFKQLAATAKGTGVEISSLVSAMQGLDTFEGSAQSAAKFNAIFGTTINSTELLMANEAERIEILKKNLAMQGRNIKSMNRWERQALASAAGFSSVEEAMRVFGNESVKVEKKAPTPLESLQKAAQAGMSWMEKIKMALNAIFGNDEMITAFTGAVNFFINLLIKAAQWMQENPFWSKFIFFASVALTVLIKVISFFAMLGNAAVIVGGGLKAFGITSLAALAPILGTIAAITLAVSSLIGLISVLHEGIANDNWDFSNFLNPFKKIGSVFGFTDDDKAGKSDHKNIKSKRRSNADTTTFSSLNSSNITEGNKYTQNSSTISLPGVPSSLSNSDTEKTIVLELDGEKFAKAVINVMNKKHNLGAVV